MSQPEPGSSKSAWSNRFEQPSVEQLIAGLGSEHAQLVDRLREELRKLNPGATERVEWQGLPWRWTLTYRSPASPDQPWAFLAPDTECPRFAMPVHVDDLDAIPHAKLRKTTREAFATAKRVGDTFWPSWDIGSQATLADVLLVVTSRAGAEAAAGRGD